MKLEFVAPCHFGLEAVLKKEIQDLGYEITKVEDGRVFFLAEEDGLARANIFLRSCERVLLKVGEFAAGTFDELFENTKALPWKTIFLQTESSGSRKHPRFHQNCSALLTSSGS